MMAKTIVIAGAGPGIGFSVAEFFGGKGFNIALIGRNEKRLKTMEVQLKKSNYTVLPFTADVTNAAAMQTVFTSIRQQFHTIDVFFYNAVNLRQGDASAESVETLLEDLRVNAAGLQTGIQLAKKDLVAARGAVLITGAGIARKPNPGYASLSAGKAALRSLAESWSALLAQEGVFVGTLSVNGFVSADSPLHNPGNIAQQFWNMYATRTTFEVLL